MYFNSGYLRVFHEKMLAWLWSKSTLQLFRAVDSVIPEIINYELKCVCNTIWKNNFSYWTYTIEMLELKLKACSVY